MAGDQFLQLFALGSGKATEPDAAAPGLDVAQAWLFQLYVVDHPARHLPQHEMVRPRRKNIDLPRLRNLPMVVKDRILESRPPHADILERPQPVESRPEDEEDIRLQRMAGMLAAVGGVSGVQVSLLKREKAKKAGLGRDPASFSCGLTILGFTS